MKYIIILSILVYCCVSVNCLPQRRRVPTVERENIDENVEVEIPEIRRTRPRTDEAGNVYQSEPKRTRTRVEYRNPQEEPPRNEEYATRRAPPRNRLQNRNQSQSSIAQEPIPDNRNVENSEIPKRQHGNQRVVHQSRRKINSAPKTNIEPVQQQSPHFKPTKSDLDYEITSLKSRHEMEIQRLNAEFDRKRMIEEAEQHEAQQILEDIHSKKREELLLLQQELDDRQKLLQEERNFTDALHKKERQELVDKNASQKKNRLDEFEKKRKILEDMHENEMELLLADQKRRSS